MLTNRLLRVEAEENINAGIETPEEVAEKLEKHAERIRCKEFSEKWEQK